MANDIFNKIRKVLTFNDDKIKPDIDLVKLSSTIVFARIISPSLRYGMEHF